MQVQMLLFFSFGFIYFFSFALSLVEFRLVRVNGGEGYCTCFKSLDFTGA